MMTFKKGLHMLLVTSAAILLAACSSTHKPRSDTAINDANAAYNSDAQSSGLGDETRFGDQANGEQLLSKRIYYFDFDSNVVHDEDKPAIAANADYLMAHPNKRVTVEGHTDPRGSREYNIALGERRARAVAQILTGKGVNSAQIRVVSYGAQKLASEGRSEADYQQDRRVVLISLQR
jgi:peptidoglycan-associated lipoprotein